MLNNTLLWFNYRYGTGLVCVTSFKLVAVVGCNKSQLVPSMRSNGQCQSQPVYVWSNFCPEPRRYWEPWPLTTVSGDILHCFMVSPPRNPWVDSALWNKWNVLPDCVYEHWMMQTPNVFQKSVGEPRELLWRQSPIFGDLSKFNSARPLIQMETQKLLASNFRCLSRSRKKRSKIITSGLLIETKPATMEE